MDAMQSRVTFQHPVWSQWTAALADRTELRPAGFKLTHFQDQFYVDQLDADVDTSGADAPLGLHFTVKSPFKQKVVFTTSEYDRTTQTVPKYVLPANLPADVIRACGSYDYSDPYWTDVYN